MSTVQAPVDLRDVLPHRYSMLLVDKIVELVPGTMIHATKAVTRGERWHEVTGTGTPDVALAYPWLLLLESWAQAAGVLVNSDTENLVLTNERMMIFGSGAGVEFHGPVYPGDVLHHHVRVARRFSDAVIFEGESLVDGDLRLTVRTLTMAFRPSTKLLREKATAQLLMGTPTPG